MSRRSERLRLRYQALVDGQSSSSSSRGSSQVAGQHTNFREGPLRTVRRKSSMVRSLSPGLSPAPHLLTGVTGWKSPGSTSGYFSEDDGAAFQWCLKNTWHCVTTAASLQDFFLSIRSVRPPWGLTQSSIHSPQSQFPLGLCSVSFQLLQTFMH
ncbi:uncharacterized protein LOC110204073 [Phascolarctos cinereus]